MVTVKFYGNLKRFNDPQGISFEAESFRELMSGLLSQLPDLSQILRKGYYKVRIGKCYLNSEQIQANPQFDRDCTVHITPVVAGAGKAGGVLSAVAGIVLIVVGVVTQQYYLAGYGAGLLFGGAVMLMTKVPKIQNGVSEGEKKQSTSFSNIRNLSPQGRAIPLLYGKMMTSLVLISQGVTAFDDIDEIGG